LFEVAEALKYKKSKPLRDVLFIACAAEEKGLIGSAHFTSDPEVRSKIAANLNVDMIGRVDTVGKSNYIYIVGSEKSPWLHDLHQRANRQTVNLALDYSQSKYLAYSDHYNFHRYGIPIIGFFSGLHDDYHTIRDTADKLDYQLLQKRIQLVYATAFLIANEPEPVVESSSVK
jgi:Zn-dependent M28 family amino/carboxypeptidase